MQFCQKKLQRQLSAVFIFEEMNFYLCCGKSLSLTFSRRAGGGARKRNSDTRRKRRGAGWSHYSLFSPFFVHSSVLLIRHFLLLLKFGFVNVVTCISLCCYMDLSNCNMHLLKLLHGFAALCLTTNKISNLIEASALN